MRWLIASYLLSPLPLSLRDIVFRHLFPVVWLTEENIVQVFLYLILGYLLAFFFFLFFALEVDIFVVRNVVG